MSALGASSAMWDSLKDALGPLALEIAESAILGCLEPNPISSCYEHELRSVHAVISGTGSGILARFPTPVNRNAFLCGCGDYTEDLPEEHLLVGYGFRHGSTTKVTSLYHVVGNANSVN